MIGAEDGHRWPERHASVLAWIGDGLAGVFIVLSAVIPFPDTKFHPSDVLGWTLVITPAITLLLRRRWPVPALGATVVLYAVAAFSGMLWPGVILAVAMAMFGVGYRSPRRVTLIATITAIVLVVVVDVVASLLSVLDPRVLALAVTLALAAALGDGARYRHEYIVAITERAERAEQTRESEARRRVSEERLRIARDLHDAVAHQIAVISLNAGVASSAIGSRPDAAQDAVHTIRTAARSVLGEIGALLDVLRADDDGIGVAPPQPGLERIDDLVSQFAASGLAVTVRTEGDLLTVGGTPDLVAYRVVQEGLTNAHKHGAESRAHVLIQVEEDVARISVTNPVTSSVAQATDDSRSGLGLVGLRERVAAVRGSIESGPTPGGWRLSATLPLTPEENA